MEIESGEKITVKITIPAVVAVIPIRKPISFF